MCGNYGCYSYTIWLIIFSENACVKSMGVTPTQNGSLYFQKIHCGIYGCYSYSIWLITFPENTCVETMGVIPTQYGSLYFQKIHVWNLCVLFLHNMTHYISRKYTCGIYGCYSYTLRLIIFPERVAVLTIISLTLGRLYQVGWRHQHKATPTMINIKSRDNNLLPFCVLLFEDQSTQHTEQGVSKPLHLPLTISFDAMKCFSSNSLKYNINNHYKSEATVSKWLAITWSHPNLGGLPRKIAMDYQVDLNLNYVPGKSLANMDSGVILTISPIKYPLVFKRNGIRAIYSIHFMAWKKISFTKHHSLNEGHISHNIVTSRGGVGISLLHITSIFIWQRPEVVTPASRSPDVQQMPTVIIVSDVTCQQVGVSQTKHERNLFMIN